MQASGILKIGETTTALAYVKGRRGISPRQVKLILILCMTLIGLPAGAWASGSWVAAAVSVECAIIGLGVGVLLATRLIGPSGRKALAERGQPCEHSFTLRLSADALTYELGNLTMTARWPDVTDLYRTRRYWVFLIQNTAVVLPRRVFATEQAEHAFITEAASWMTTDARARSPDVTKSAAT